MHVGAKLASDGRCSKCESIRRMEYRARNLDKALAYRAAYKERELALEKARRAANPEPHRERVRKYREAHPDRVKANTARQYRKDRKRAIARASEWKRANAEKVRVQQKEWRAKNKDKVRATNVAQYAKADKAKRLLKGRAWQNANREKVRASVRKWNRSNAHWATCRAAKLNATPKWADRKAVLAAYLEARRLTKETGVQHHVDHIVPLKSPIVCGLHVEHNLQVIPGVENSRKGNRHWPDMSSLTYTALSA